MQPTTDRDTTAWYLIHTKPRQEHIALTNLERQGYTCYLPQLRVEKIRRRKAEVVSEPMFARYLFVRLSTSDNGPSWAPIRATLGVSQLVRFGTRPAKVEDPLVDLLRNWRDHTRRAAKSSLQAKTTLVRPALPERDGLLTTISTFRPKRFRHSSILASLIPRNWPRNIPDSLG